MPVRLTTMTPANGPSNEELKARLRAAARDKLYQVMLDLGRVRGAVVHATGVVAEMRRRHRLGPVETLVLGQAMVAATLMSTDLGSGGRVKVSCDCAGPVGGLVVEANSFGEVRGYLRHVPVEVPGDGEVPRLRDLFGSGQLVVTRHRTDESGESVPSTGIVEMQHGTLAQDLAYYYATSQQTPTALNLSVAFDDTGNLTGAGGLLLQAMPGADVARIAEIEARLTGLHSLGGSFAAGADPVELIEREFAPFQPSIIGQRRTAFFCRCARDRFLAYIGALGEGEIEDMLAHEQFPVAVTCAYCSAEYLFERDELQQLAAGRG